MKLSILLACSAVATCACSSNKPAHDPTQVSVGDPSSTPAPAERTYEVARPNDQNTSPAPGVTDTSSTMPPPPAAAEAPPGPAPAPNTTVSNAPATMGTTSPQPEPDNTRVNKRDRGSNAPTPMDQGNGSSDLKITQQIRQAVVADGTLSFTAKNVKIITTNGKVTLRGPVNNAQERTAIEASARRVAGDTNVDNQIEVKK